MINNTIMGILLIVAGLLWSACLMQFPPNIANAVAIPWGIGYGVVAMLYFLAGKEEA